MKIITLSYRGNFEDLLKRASYQWRATEIFGSELLRNNYDELIYSLYIRKKDLNYWLGQIKKDGSSSKDVLENRIRLFVVEKLPKPYEKNDKIVNLDTLVEDLKHSWAIRYWENHAGHLKRLYNRYHNEKN